ncbi:MAG: hypothetical protein E7Z85_03540 [Methanosphaera stadtmanae]|nr:hypothetical protein [Methanosphaera stadtmanae]
MTMGQFQLINTTPVLILENNLITDIIVIIAGFTFSILSIFLTVTNGVNLGYLLATSTYLQSLNVYLPHVLDSISWIFALVGAFLVTKIEVRLISTLINRKVDIIFSKIKVPLKDLILTIMFIIIFLLMGLFVGLII